MATLDATVQSGIPVNQVPLELQDLCSELSHSGQLYLRRIARLIDVIAPKPGSLLYLRANRLAIRVNGLNPVIFSAVDATTHLQVAQVYLGLTTAAAVSFVDFVSQSFPFRISQIRTSDEVPFHYSDGNQSRRDFSAMVGERGLVTSIIPLRSEDALFSITSRLVFGAMAKGSIVLRSELGLQKELEHFLFFHNNYRPIPWLDGNTPLQKLKSFEGFAGVHTFSSNEESQRGFGHPEIKAPDGKMQSLRALKRA
jgi:hypothetical protein